MHANKLHPLLLLVLFFGNTSISGQLNMEFTISENCPLNFFVGNLNNPPPMSNTLPSYGTSLNTFQLLTPTTLFYLNESSGDLLTRSQIDRETICSEPPSSANILNNIPLHRHGIEQRLPDSAADSTCRVRLQALQFTHSVSQSDDQRHHVLIIHIYIADVNDNPPSWPESTIGLSLAEHTPVGTRFPLPVAFDPDCGPTNTTASYTVRKIPTNGNRESDYTSIEYQEAFQLDTELTSDHIVPEYGVALWSTHLVTCVRRQFKLWLRVIRDLEYDEVPTVHDGQKILGHLRPSSLKLRHMQLHLLGIDGGQPIALTGSVLLSITVTDTNDHAPMFRLQKKPAETQRQQFDVTALSDEEVIEIEENTAVGRVVYTAQAVDVDEIDRGKLKFYMDATATSITRSVFEIRPKTGELILLQTVDYEKTKYFIVPIGVTDGKHRVSLKIHVLVRNQNDHVPTISIQPVGSHGLLPLGAYDHLKRHLGAQSTHTKSMVTLYVKEHEPPGRFIATVTVSDADEVQGHENLQASFSSHESSAHMIPNNNFENKDLYDTRILCQINHKGLALQSLFDGALNQFKLITTSKFDREQQTEQYAVLTCTDRGQPQLSAQMSIHLIIEDINDHGPSFKQNRMTAYLRENEPPGTKVYVVEATDPDVGINAQLSFSLDVEHSNDFVIDPITGVLTSSRPFNREQEEYFNLTVTVMDRVMFHPQNRTLKHTPDTTEEDPQKQHFSTGKLLVYIQDINDCPPVFANSLYQLSVPEDAKSNLLLGQINANDSDATEANNQIHYVLKPQTGNLDVQEFRVSPQGYLYVARGNLDREKVSSYSFFLVAIDSGTPPLSSSTQVHIYLTDVNDNAPAWVFPTHNNQIINVTVSEPVGYRIAQLKAVDPDDGENGEVQYRLVQSSRVTITDVAFNQKHSLSATGSHVGNVDDGRPPVQHYPRQDIKDLFELDPVSGSIYVGRSMSLDDIGTAKLVVEASDHGNPPKVNHRVFQVNVLRYLSQPSAFSAKFGDVGGSEGEKTSNKGNSINQSGHIENDLVVIVIMVAITLIISLVLIMAILFLRCGVCPSRRFVQYSSALQNDCRHSLNRTHHLEEVFRDSGNIGELISTGNCNQFSDNCLGAFQRVTEAEQMCQSFLSTSGADPWNVTTASSRNSCNRGLETINFNRPGGSVSRFYSPILMYDTTGRPTATGVTTKPKRLCERSVEPHSVASSPNHEVKVILAKRTGHQSEAVACSTFRASCSHLLNTPSKLVRKCEDIDSLDSGQGRSSATENGIGSFQDTTNGDGKHNSQLSTFGCLPSHKSHYEGNQSTDQPQSDNEPGRLERQCIFPSRTKCGTLPLSFCEEHTKNMSAAKSTTDVSTDKYKCGKPEGRSLKSAAAKARQSVTWLDPDHEMCDRHAQMECFTRGVIPPQAHTEEKFTFDDDTLVLFSPSDPLGYTQLTQSPSIGNCERMSPNQSVYSSFPSSFV